MAGNSKRKEEHIADKSSMATGTFGWSRKSRVLVGKTLDSAQWEESFQGF